MALRDKVKRIEREDPERIIRLYTDAYGVFWTGQTRFVFGSVSSEAWEGNNVKIKEEQSWQRK